MTLPPLAMVPIVLNSKKSRCLPIKTTIIIMLIAVTKHFSSHMGKKKKNLPNFLVETIRGPWLSFDSFPSKRFTDFTCGRNTTWCKGRKCHTNLWWTTNDKILKTSWVMLENMKTRSRASVDGDESHVYVVLLYLLRQNYYRDTNLFYVFIFVLVFLS